MDKDKIDRVIRIIDLLEGFVDDSKYEIIAEARFTVKMLEEEKKNLIYDPELYKCTYPKDFWKECQAYNNGTCMMSITCKVDEEN